MRAGLSGLPVRYPYRKIRSLGGVKIKRARSPLCRSRFLHPKKFQIRILQHFSRSTRFANLCTAPDSKFADLNFAKFCNFSVIFKFSQNFAVIFRRNFHGNFAGISQNFRNFDEIDVEISNFQKILRKSGKFAEILLDILEGSDVE